MQLEVEVGGGGDHSRQTKRTQDPHLNPTHPHSPPIRLRASTTVTQKPLLVRVFAAARPDTPAPTTTTDLQAGRPRSLACGEPDARVVSSTSEALFKTGCPAAHTANNKAPAITAVRMVTQVAKAKGVWGSKDGPLRVKVGGTAKLL